MAIKQQDSLRQEPPLLHGKLARQLSACNALLDSSAGLGASGKSSFKWIHCYDRRLFHPMCLRYPDGGFVYDYICDCGTNVRDGEHRTCETGQFCESTSPGSILAAVMNADLREHLTTCKTCCGRLQKPVNRVQWRNIVSQTLQTDFGTEIWLGLYNGDGSRVKDQYVLCKWLAPDPDRVDDNVPNIHREFYAKGTWEPFASASFVLACPPTNQVPTIPTTTHVINIILADQEKRKSRHDCESYVSQMEAELHRDTEMRRNMQYMVRQANPFGGIAGQKGPVSFGGIDSLNAGNAPQIQPSTTLLDR